MYNMSNADGNIIVFGAMIAHRVCITTNNHADWKFTDQHDKISCGKMNHRHRSNSPPWRSVGVTLTSSSVSQFITILIFSIYHHFLNRSNYYPLVSHLSHWFPHSILKPQFSCAFSSEVSLANYINISCFFSLSSSILISHTLALQNILTC